MLVLLMGCLAITAPFLAGSLGLFLVGLLLIVSVVVPNAARQAAMVFRRRRAVLGHSSLAAEALHPAFTPEEEVAKSP